ncbi:MAG: hypothetical protein ABIR54_09865 [Burkholderiaceae bacterium]
MKPPTASRLRTAALAIAATLAVHQSACAGGASSELSEASLVPVAISVALPVVLVAGAGSIVVTGVQASAQGTAWIVENVADGVKGSICFAGNAVAVAGIAVGTVIVVTVVTTGRLLSAAGHVIAFIPNEVGRSLSYNQRVSR